MGIGNIGIDTDRLAVTFDRLLDLTSLIKQITQIDVRGGQQRIGGQGAAVAVRRLLQARGLGVGIAHVRQGIGVFGQKLQNQLIKRYGFVRPALSAHKSGQVEGRIDMAGIIGQNLVVQGCRRDGFARPVLGQRRAIGLLGAVHGLIS